MTARETNLVNAFETTLAAQLASGGTSMNLTDDPGVDSPALSTKNAGTATSATNISPSRRLPASKTWFTNSDRSLCFRLGKTRMKP